MFAEGVAVVSGDGDLDELLEHRLAADLRIDDLPRRLPLAEPGDADLLRDAGVGAVQVLAELVGLDLDRELDGVGAGGLEGRLHGGRVSETADPSGAARGARRAPDGGNPCG